MVVASVKGTGARSVLAGQCVWVPGDAGCRAGAVGAGALQGRWQLTVVGEAGSQHAGKRRWHRLFIAVGMFASTPYTLHCRTSVKPKPESRAAVACA